MIRREAGNDRLIGGDDVLTGRAGDDQFVFDRRHGNDTIVDFVPGAELIRFSIEGLGFAALDIRSEGANVWIDTEHGSITLIGVSEADLTVDGYCSSEPDRRGRGRVLSFI